MTCVKASGSVPFNAKYMHAVLSKSANHYD